MPPPTSDTVDDKIAIRLFVEVSGEADAEATARMLQAKVAAHGRICRSYTARYWKIAEYFEVFLDLETGATTAMAFDAILITLATGWVVHRFPERNNWAVWNPSDTAVFTLPNIRWANVECYRQSTSNPERQDTN